MYLIDDWETSEAAKIENQRVKQAVEPFAEIGVGNIKRLQGIDPPEFRLRVSDYRVRFHRDSETLLILRVRNRREAYRKGLMRRRVTPVTRRKAPSARLPSALPDNRSNLGPANADPKRRHTTAVRGSNSLAFPEETNFRSVRSQGPAVIGGEDPGDTISRVLFRTTGSSEFPCR